MTGSRRFPEKTRQALLDESCRYTPCISSLLACAYTPQSLREEY